MVLTLKTSTGACYRFDTDLNSAVREYPKGRFATMKLANKHLPIPKRGSKYLFFVSDPGGVGRAMATADVMEFEVEMRELVEVKKDAR